MGKSNYNLLSNIHKHINLFGINMFYFHIIFRNVLPWTFYTNSPNKDVVASHTTPSSSSSSSLAPANRTSPVAVPVPGRLRQRNESSSSTGSWQMISGTGSLRGSTTANSALPEFLNGAGSACKAHCGTCSGQTSQESSITIIEDESTASVTQ